MTAPEAVTVAHRLAGIGATRGACQVLFNAALQAKPAPVCGVQVKAHTRKKPINHKQVALHNALRAARSVPTEGQAPSCGRAA